MSENEFIKQLQNQEARAFSLLVDDYQQKVFSTCLSFVPNREDAEDIAQDVFVEVFNSINKFKTSNLRPAHEDQVHFDAHVKTKWVSANI